MCEANSDIDRYIDNHSRVVLDDHQVAFDNYIRQIKRFRPVDAETRILEIGTGTGWFPIMCKLRGLHCTGLEISPRLIEYAIQVGSRYGVEPDIRIGNIEETDVGRGEYDAIVAANVFEHVQHWKPGLARVYEALKPGGVFYFESSNKFSLMSGEYGLPLYGWLPDAWRYRLRIARQGPDIMKLGIDFNQFTHGQLRREFRRAGFSRVLDRVDLADGRYVSTPFRKAVVAMARTFPPLKSAALLFADATRFVCVK